jgi:hypothetical protein
MSQNQNITLDRIRGDTQITKYAIIIGINYKGSSLQLNGCEIDALRMDAFFKAQGYTTIKLTATDAIESNNANLMPTRENIVKTIQSMNRFGALQKFGLFYAGHGTQVQDMSGDEADGMDECLVCQSSSGPSGRPSRRDYLVDDDLIALLLTCFAARNVECTLMFDACHSGTVLDLGWEVGNGMKLQSVKGYVQRSVDRVKLLCFSGAQDYQCALEAGNSGGLMTNMFLACARRGNLAISEFYKEFAKLGCQKPHITASFPINVETSTFANAMIVAETVPGTRSIVASRANLTNNRSSANANSSLAGITSAGIENMGSATTLSLTSAQLHRNVTVANSRDAQSKFIIFDALSAYGKLANGLTSKGFILYAKPPIAPTHG